MTEKTGNRNQRSAKNLLFLTTVTVMLLTLILAPTSLAQRAASMANDATPPPKYQVTENGTLIFEGDIRVDCRSLFKIAEEEGTENSADIRGGVEACTEAGFPSARGPLDSGGPPLLLGAGALLAGTCALSFFVVRRRRTS